MEQAGQLVNDRHVRFDFTHFSALTPEELAQVELLVNEEILKAVPVSMVEMPIEEARQSGAMALFGEKYGDVVRVVSVEDGFSKEFCGGTHMDNTARLGLFKILSETSVASGVRRIEGVTGMGVLAMLASQTGTLLETARAMKVLNPMELPLHARQTMQELKDKDREIETLNAKLAQNRLNDVFQNAQDVDGVKVVYALLSGTGPDALRALCDKAKEREEAIVAVFAGVTEGKATLAASCNKAAQDRGLKAGVLVKAVAQLCGGNGGGRPDFAMAGAKDQSQAGRRFGGGGWAGAAAAGVSSRSHKKESALRAGRSFRVILNESQAEEEQNCQLGPVQAGRRFGGGGWAGAAAGISSRSHKKESALCAGRSFRVIQTKARRRRSRPASRARFHRVKDSRYRPRSSEYSRLICL